MQDSGGGTALTSAAFHGHTTVVQALLDARADASLPLAAGHQGHHAAFTIGYRVSIDGLKGRPELNGRSGVAGRFDAANRRYEVARWRAHFRTMPHEKRLQGL